MVHLFNKIKFEYRITVLYFIIGILWILFSDRFVESLALDYKIVVIISITKGFFYVFVTSLLLYLLVRKHLNRISSAENIIKQRNEELEKQNIELKNLKEIAEESESYFRLLVENAPEAIFIQIDSKFAYVNKAAINLYGALDEQHLIGTKIIDRIHPDFIEFVKKRIVQLNDLRQPVEMAEFKQLKLNNTEIDVAVLAVPFKYQNKNGALVFVRDVSERKQIEEKLKKSFDLLNNLAKQVPGVIYQYRLYPDGHSAFPYSSPGMYDIYEVTSDEVREDASPVFTRIHPDDYNNIVDTINESAKNQTDYHSEFRVILPKQGERWRECFAKPELLDDGSTLWHGIIMDITDRKIAEELYIQKNEEVNTFFDCAIDLLCISDTSGTFLRLNKEWENVLYYSIGELIGQKFIEYVHPEDVESTINATKQLADQIVVSNFTNRYRCKDGTYKWIEWKSYPKGEFIFAAARDITEKVQQKQDLIAAKEKIEKSEEIFRKAFYTNPEAITITRIDNGTYISVNNGFVRMLGYSEKEAIGHSSLELNIWHDISNRNYFIETIKKDGIIENFETKFQTKNGKIIDGIVSSAVIELDKIPHILSIIRDISYRKMVENELRESKEQLNFAFEGSNDGLWDVNMKTGAVFINSRGCEILGYLPNEMDEVVKVWSDLVHPDDLPATNSKLQAHIENKSTVFEVEQRLRTKSGEWKWILSRGKVVSRDADDLPLRMTGTHTDISERVAFKEALIMKNMELEASEEEIHAANEELFAAYDELRKINIELENAKVKAEESNRLKTAFLQNMSHEIRTPMNAIMGFSELLVRNFDDKTKLEYFSNIINQRCNDLLAILNDILDISKIESGQLTVSNESCDLSSLFAELKNFFTEQQNRLDKKQINFFFTYNHEVDNLQILTDTVKLKQIFINLIGNAFKFTDSGSIECGCKLHDNNTLLFYISDSGMGIPLEKQEVIFDRFTQYNPSSTRLYGGTGLGLSIVKGLIDLLGGKIWLESEPEKGSTFFFTIPYKSAKSEEFEVSAHSEVNFNEIIQSPTILVVEDDVFNTSLIKEILSEAKLNAIYTQKGIEAIEIAKTSKIDLILMDIRLPDITGYEAVQQILLFKPEMKIIAQTAYATPSDKQKAMDSGCIGYISKPLKEKLLLELIKKHLTKH